MDNNQNDTEITPSDDKSATGAKAENIEDSQDLAPTTSSSKQTTTPLSDEQTSSSLDQNQATNRRVGTSPSGWEISASSTSNHDITGRPGEGWVVRLIQEANNHEPNTGWGIRKEFFHEDVARNHDVGETEDDDDDSMSNHVDDDQGQDGYFDAEDIDEVNHDNEHDVEDGDDGDEANDDDDMALMLDGYEIPPDDQMDSDTENEDINESDLEAYDRGLPVNHPYLGEDLQDSRGHRILIEGTYATLPLLNIGNLVLLPGQSMPVSTASLHHRVSQYLKVCLDQGQNTFGTMYNPQTNHIGTIADIRSFSAQGEEYNFIIEGRQRFQLISAPFVTAIEGQVRILPEINLGSPYPPMLTNMNAFPLLKRGTFNNIRISKHPNFVYRMYDSVRIRERILAQISGWSDLIEVHQNPQEFSYWMTSNLPISNKDKARALRFSCTEARLLWLLDLLENNTSFGCASCKSVICSRHDVIPMSKAGALNAYINPGGYIHETITVRAANNVLLASPWSNEYSWFPGYAWRYAYCACNRHLGWCYQAINPKITPRLFFGFTRENIRLQ